MLQVQTQSQIGRHLQIHSFIDYVFSQLNFCLYWIYKAKGLIKVCLHLKMSIYSSLIWNQESCLVHTVPHAHTLHQETTECPYQVKKEKNEMLARPYSKEEAKATQNNCHLFVGF